MEESVRGCGEEQLGRVQRYYDLADKYNLKLVAGTFVKVPWSGRATEEDLCRNTKCLGFPFPDGQIRPGESEGLRNHKSKGLHYSAERLLL